MVRDDVDFLMQAFLRHAQERPWMLGLDGSFGEYVAFLNGLDMGAGGRVLERFGEWAARRAGHEGRDLAWPLVLLREAGIDRPAGAWHRLAAEDDARAVVALFEALSEFSRDRS
jgi:hypothetical protein